MPLKYLPRTGTVAGYEDIKIKEQTAQNRTPMGTGRYESVRLEKVKVNNCGGT